MLSKVAFVPNLKNKVLWFKLLQNRVLYAAFGRVNKDFKCFLVGLSGGQREEKFSALLSSKREKMLPKFVPNRLKNKDFLA